MISPLPVISATMRHVVPDRVADLFESEQLAHHRQLEGPVIILNKTKLKIYFDKLLKIQLHLCYG